MALLRPNQLPDASLPLNTVSDVLVLDQGTGGVTKVLIPALTEAGIPIATQNEAEAGALNAKRMTPLRTKQAFDEFLTGAEVLKYGAAQSLSPEQQEQARDNIGSGFAAGTINVSALDSGVLELAPNIVHWTLAGHGGADFTISGFGDLHPVGAVVALYIPRTVGMTGGSANALGNKVAFTHATSGPGLDLSMNVRALPSSFVYTYNAYPDACDADGRAAALAEVLTFVHEGSGRWRLVRLPEPVIGSNSKGRWTRWASGLQFFELTNEENRSSSGNLSTGVTLPVAAVATPLGPKIDGSFANVFWAFQGMAFTVVPDNVSGVAFTSPAAGSVTVAINRSTSGNTGFVMQGRSWWK